MVMFFLKADGRVSTMSGNYPCIIGQVVKTVPDGIRDLFKVSSRKISSPDSAIKKCIPGSNGVQFTEIKRNTSGGMTGTGYDG